MSKHEFKTRDQQNQPVAWSLEFARDGIHVVLSKVTAGSPQQVTAFLTPQEAEDLRELLALYQNSQKRRGGK